MRLPFVPNHILFAAAASVTALAALIWGFWRGGRGAGPASLDRAFALIRCEVLIMYFFVTLHKINYDYFNDDVSCSVAMYREIGSWLPILPSGSWVRMPTILGVLAFEGLIPILLAIPRTRVLGVGLGLVFHYLLSLHPNPYVYSYSAMMFALFTLFVPDDFLADLWVTVERIPIWRLAALIVFGVMAGVGILMSKLLVDPAELDDTLFVWVRPVWMVLGFTAMAIYAATLIRRSGAEWRRLVRGPELGEPSYFRPAVSWLLIFPVLVVFNACCPYLGLKTQTAFAMFSNLRTEGGWTNHLFMPIRFRLADYQDDLVEVVESSDSQLRTLTERGLCLTYFELRRAASSNSAPDFTVTYLRNGRRITASRTSDRTAEWSGRGPWLLRKLLYFRPVQLGSEPQSASINAHGRFFGFSECRSRIRIMKDL